MPSPEYSLIAVVAAGAVFLAAAKQCQRALAHNRTGIVPASRRIDPLLHSTPPLRAPGSTGFSVASFNILLKKFATRDYGSYVPAPYRDWASHRLPLLYATLDNLNCDIIAVQEASVLTFAEDMQPWLTSRGYGLVAPYDKDAFKKQHDLAKTGILYRKAAFTETWAHHRSRTVLASLVHNATGNTVYVVNCHLEGHPQRARDRFSQIRSSLAAAEARIRVVAAGESSAQQKKQKRNKPEKTETGARAPQPADGGKDGSNKQWAKKKASGSGEATPTTTAAAAPPSTDTTAAAAAATAPASHRPEQTKHAQEEEDPKDTPPPPPPPASTSGDSPAKPTQEADLSTRAAPNTTNTSSTHSTRPPYVLVVGDFNSSREHCVYTLLNTGSLQPDFDDSWGGPVTDSAYTCPFALKDAYAQCKVPLGTYLANGHKPTLIDFLFVSKELQVETVRPPYSEEQLAAALRTGIPNAWWVSDHFPLAAVLRFPEPARDEAQL